VCRVNAEILVFRLHICIVILVILGHVTLCNTFDTRSHDIDRGSPGNISSELGKIHMYLKMLLPYS